MTKIKGELPWGGGGGFKKRGGSGASQGGFLGGTRLQRGRGGSEGNCWWEPKGKEGVPTKPEKQTRRHHLPQGAAGVGASSWIEPDSVKRGGRSTCKGDVGGGGCKGGIAFAFFSRFRFFLEEWRPALEPWRQCLEGKGCPQGANSPKEHREEWEGGPLPKGTKKLKSSWEGKI